MKHIKAATEKKVITQNGQEYVSDVLETDIWKFCNKVLLYTFFCLYELLSSGYRNSGSLLLNQDAHLCCYYSI